MPYCCYNKDKILQNQNNVRKIKLTVLTSDGKIRFQPLQIQFLMKLTVL